MRPVRLLGFSFCALASVACDEASEEIYLPEGEDRVVLHRAPGEFLSHAGVRIQVPEADHAVAGEVIFEDGHSELIFVANRRGEVELQRSIPLAAAAVSGLAVTGGPDPCQDDAYQLGPWRVKNRFDWQVRMKDRPEGVTASAFEKAAKAAVQNIVRTDNSCGVGGDISARQKFLGRTKRGPQITSEGSCAKGDGHNVVSFGTLPNGILGVACTHYSSAGEVIEGDIRLNSRNRWTTAPTSSSCTGRYDVESVLTHEFGHTFGLLHVSEQSHGQLTMSEAINGACRKDERTLGSGDVKALQKKY